MNSMPSNYVSRKAQIQTEIDGLLAEKSRLSESLANYNPEGVISSAVDVPFQMLGNFAGANAEGAKFFIMICIAVVCELGGCLSFAIAAFVSEKGKEIALSDQEMNRQRREAQQRRKLANLERELDEIENSDRYSDSDADSDPFAPRTSYSTRNQDAPNRAGFRRYEINDDEPDDHGRSNGNGARANGTSTVHSTSTNTIQDYVVRLYSNGAKSGDQLLGRRSIQDAGFRKEETDRFHQQLKKAGLVRVQDNRTYANFEKDDVLERLQQSNRSGLYANILAFSLMFVPALAFAQDGGGSSGDNPLMLLLMSVPVALVALWLFPQMWQDSNTKAPESEFRQARRGMGASGFLILILSAALAFGIWAFVPRNNYNVSNYQYYFQGIRSVHDLQK